MSGNPRNLQHLHAGRHLLQLLALQPFLFAGNYLAVRAINPSVRCTTAAKHFSTSLASHVGATMTSTLPLTPTFLVLHMLITLSHC